MTVETGESRPVTDDIILKHMRTQAQIAIDTADAIVFMCDVRTEVTANDRDIATIFRKAESRSFPV